jgi:UDP-2,4-diacetamido-2,4,6-trideoxy-beta-L-altropyranose hydrolase
MNQQIIIRADGGKQIGMGHLSRAVLISDYMLNKYGIETVLLVKSSSYSESFLVNCSSRIEWMQNDISTDEELRAITASVKRYNCCLFILDVLKNDIDQTFTNEVNKNNVPFVAITDDSGKRAINADVIINGNPLQDASWYCQESANYCIGPQFFIMDERYENINSIMPSEGVDNILLSVGGSDHGDILFKILDSIEMLNRKINVTIITSYGTGYIDSLKQYLSTYSSLVELKIDVPGLYDEFFKCDIALTAGGNTLFERIASRKPGATVCQLPRQMEIADQFSTLGVNTNIGYGPHLTTREISLALDEYIKDNNKHIEQCKMASSVIDGFGLSRVATILMRTMRN